MPGRSVHIQTKAPLSLWLQAYPGSRICQAPPVRQCWIFLLSEKPAFSENLPFFIKNFRSNLEKKFLLFIFVEPFSGWSHDFSLSLLSHFLADHMILVYLCWAFSIFVTWSYFILFEPFALGPLLWGSSNSPFVEPFAPSRESLFIFLLSLLWLDTYSHMTSWNDCEIYLGYGMQASISYLYFRCD